MATITSYFEQAQLSLAAYATGLHSGMPNADYEAALVHAGMTDAQAEEFADTYTVIDQYNDPFTGFSGTVFKHKDGSLHFAIRGTENLLDWVTANFRDIGADGVAIYQGIAMFNWLQRLYGAPGTEVVQYTYNLDETISTSMFAIPVGAPSLYGQATPVSVAGHSLGGHLAMMLSRLAPSRFDAVYTYNAPGFDTALRTNLFPLTSDGSVINFVCKAPESSLPAV